MLFRTHFAISLLVGVLVAHFFNNSLFFVILVIFFGLLPDIDTPFSHVGRRRCFYPFQWLSGHRKIFHSFILVLIISLGLLFFSKFLMWSFLIGYSSHLFADTLTIRGIQPFYPLEFKIRGFIKTGGFAELILFIACFFVVILILI